jgi:hypothetical protein
MNMTGADMLGVDIRLILAEVFFDRGGDAA